MQPLSIDELRWLHATEAILTDDNSPSLRVRTCPLSRTSQRHRHYHLLDDAITPPSPRKPSDSLIPAPVTRPTPPRPTEWIYRSPKRPPRAPLAPLSTPARPPSTRPVHSVIAKPLSAKDNEKERTIWTMLGLADSRPKQNPKPLPIVITRPTPPQRNRASSASSNSTANSTTSAHSASTSATSPSPSVPASPKPPSVPTKSILSRSPSVSSRPTPQRSLAALFTRGPSSGSVSGSVKSVTFVDEPTVHYPDEYDSDIEQDHVPKSSYGDLDLDLDQDDLASGLTKGALAWEMGLDIDTMDLDLSLELDVAPAVNLDAPLELEIGQKYVPPKREQIGGILEEDEEVEDEDVTPLAANKHGLRRFLSLTKPPNAAPPKTERKLKRRSAPLPTRPTISGPFALGSPPATYPMTLYPFASRSTTSLRSQARSTTTSSSTSTSTSSTSTSTIRARSNSNSTDTLPVLVQRTHRGVPRASSVPSTPIHTKHRTHSHAHSRRPRTAPSSTNPSPISTTSSIALGAPPRCGPYPSSLHTAPSLESFRSAAGRSVRSLASIKSTASARSAIRALLGKIGIGAGAGSVRVDE